MAKMVQNPPKEVGFASFAIVALVKSPSKVGRSDRFRPNPIQKGGRSMIFGLFTFKNPLFHEKGVRSMDFGLFTFKKSVFYENLDFFPVYPLGGGNPSGDSNIKWALSDRNRPFSGKWVQKPEK